MPRTGRQKELVRQPSDRTKGEMEDGFLARLDANFFMQELAKEYREFAKDPGNRKLSKMQQFRAEQKVRLLMLQEAEALEMGNMKGYLALNADLENRVDKTTGILGSGREFSMEMVVAVLNRMGNESDTKS